MSASSSVALHLLFENRFTGLKGSSLLLDNQAAAQIVAR